MRKFNKLKIFLIFALALILGFGGCWAFSVREMTLKLAQVSDVHISDKPDTTYKLLSRSKELLADTVKQINTMQDVDFVMFTGDMVNSAYYESYKDFFTILADLKYPTLVAFGNHDTAGISSTTGELLPKGTLGKSEVLDMFQKAIPNYKFDKTYYALSPKQGFRLIVLDLVVDKDMSSNGNIDDEQLKFLNNELNEHKNDIILIFQHFPVVEPFASEDHSILNAEKYMEVVQKYKNPIAIFAGHYHATKIVQQNNIIHVASPSLVTYPNAFRVVSVTNYNDRAVFDFYFKETTLAEVQANAKAIAVATASFAGLEKDRNTTITIKRK